MNDVVAVVTVNRDPPPTGHVANDLITVDRFAAVSQSCIEVANAGHLKVRGQRRLGWCRCSRQHFLIFFV